MKPRPHAVLLVLLFVVLVAGVLWLGLRRPIALHAEPKPAEPASAVSATPPSNLEPGEQLESPIVEPPRSDLATVVNIGAVADDEMPQTVVLYGLLSLAPGFEPGSGPSWLTVTDRLGASTRVRAGEDGAYSVSGLDPGRHWLSAGSDSTARTAAVLDLSLADSPKRFDMTLTATPSLLVKALDEENRPLEKMALLAVATRTSPGEWFEEVHGSLNNPFGIGRFRFNGDPLTKLPEDYLGRLVLDVQPPVYVSLVHYHRVVATQRALEGDTEIVFVVDSQSPSLQPGGLRFRFVRDDGIDVPEATAMLEGASGTRSLKRENGTFTATRLAPGWYRIRTFTKGFARNALEVRVEPDVDQDLGPIHLEPEVWISGTVSAAEMLSGRERFRCDPFDPTSTGAERSYSITVFPPKEDGTFRIDGLSRGLHLLKLGDRESGFGAWARVIDTRGGPVENVRVDLVRGVPLVLRSSSEDWASVRFRVLNGDGTPVVSSRLWVQAPQTWMLAPGEYELEVSVDATEPTRRRITIGKQPVELSLP